MSESILVTGGAGFIGSHLVDALVARGHRVVVLDALVSQVHGDAERPAYLHPDVELIRGDVRDAETLGPILERVDVVFHLAAMVGVGQSMYEITRYTSGNTLAAAALLQAIVDAPRRIRKMIVASSMSIYGEGEYSCSTHGAVAPRLRPESQLKARQWEPGCPTCSEPLAPMPTTEAKPLFPSSIYAINKRDHEEMFLVTGQAYGIPTVALRFFNVYGSRQALGNPYTGVAAIFSSRLLRNQAPLVFEDGGQLRDFTHVQDIVQGLVLAMEGSGADYQAVNLGTGRPASVLDVAEVLRKSLEVEIGHEVTGQYRAGDIRHCYADISRARALLGYEPRVPFEQGIGELMGWLRKQPVADDGVAGAYRELASRGLAR
jgi:dTDP-L-rhamnose 4-epimerase